MDGDLYQSVMGMDAAKGVVKEKGVIIRSNSCGVQGRVGGMRSSRD